MVVLRKSRLAGRAVLAAGLVTSMMAGITGMGTAGAATAGLVLPTRSAAVSWGHAEFGRLGDGDLADDKWAPVSVTGLTSGVVAVSAGMRHGMALTSDGRVWTWGDNTSGELGNGTTGTGSAVAAPVAGLTSAVQVGAGDGNSYALRSDGTVWAWGFNGTATNALTPVQVPGLTGVTQIAVSVSGFVLALRSDGTVWGWGSDRLGVLGAGAGPGGGYLYAPIRVKGLSGVTKIAAGGGAALAVTHRTVAGAPTTQTEVWAWGDNQEGQLGDGAQGPQVQPVPQLVPGLPQVAAIASGPTDALVTGSDGSVWAWGDDTSGQLGNSPRTAPVLSPVETFAPGSKITQISATFDHTLALRSDGTVLAFGSNNWGQIGDFVTGTSSLPVQVSDLSGASQVSAGYGYSLAVHTVPLRSHP